MLAGHNAVDANVPHHRRAVPTGFELVIDLLLLVGTLNGRAAFVNQLPLLRPASGSGKQAKIIAAVCMVCPPVFGIGVPEGQRASPLAAILGYVKPVWLHFVAFRTDRNTRWRNVNVTFRRRILLAAVIKIDEGLDVLMIQKHVNRLSIMSGIEQHLIDDAKVETLLASHHTHN